MLHDSGHLGAMALYCANETFYGVIAVAEVIILFKVLPDALGAQSFGYCGFDDVTIWLTGAL
jgi:hypothetical protein